MYPSDLNRLVLAHVLALGATLALPRVAAAQGTAADYARAEELRASYEALAVDIAGPATAIGRTHRFWYRKTVRGTEQFVVVDADTQRREPAFDHDKIAESLSKATGNSDKPAALPFTTLAFTPDGSRFTVNVGGSPYRCTVADSSCQKVETAPRAGAGVGADRRPDEGPVVSPDGKWEALINNYNVVIRQAGTRTLTRLSTDGSEGNSYDPRRLPGRPTRRRSPPIASDPATSARCTTSNHHRTISSSRSTLARLCQAGRRARPRTAGALPDRFETPDQRRQLALSQSVRVDRSRVA